MLSKGVGGGGNSAPRPQKHSTPKAQALSQAQRPLHNPPWSPVQPPFPPPGFWSQAQSLASDCPGSDLGSPWLCPWGHLCSSSSGQMGISSSVRRGGAVVFPAALRQPRAGRLAFFRPSFLPSFLLVFLSFLVSFFLFFFFFNVGHFLVFTEFVIVLFLFFMFWFWGHKACGISAP